MSSLPPLPAGFTLDSEPAQGVPPLPDGFTLDTQPAQATAQPQAAPRPQVAPQPDLTPREVASEWLTGAPLRAAGEIGLMGVTGLAGQVAGGLAGIVTGGDADVVRGVQEAMTYQPRSRMAQQALRDVGAIAETANDRIVEPFFRSAAAYNPRSENLLRSALPAAVEAAGVLTPVGRAAAVRRASMPKTAQEVMGRMAPTDSAGASAAAMRVADAPQELQQAIVKAARRNAGAVNPEAVRRHMEGETLPVPVRYTEGQALQDAGRISNEMNLRGRVKDLAGRFEEQNKALAGNIQAIRDRAGPDVFSTNAAEHGDTLMGAYKAMDDARRADIDAKYKALADANGGTLPINGQQFVTTAAASLKKQMKVPFLPGPIKQIMVGIRNGEPMTIESFENLRTALAAEARKADRAGDGNAAGAISIVRDALESVPVEGASAQVKALADAARKAARERFAAIDADPAYKAVVNEKVTPDDFVRRYVIGGKRDNVETMLRNIGSDDSARQTLSVATIDHLRDAAALNPMYEGNFAAARYNKALQNLSPKLRHLLSPEDIETVEQLGRVAKDVTFQPRGSYVNNSNTFVAAAADYGADALEGAANMKLPGLGTGARWGLNALSRNRYAKRALGPGAGLDVLAEPSNALATGGGNALRP